MAHGFHLGITGYILIITFYFKLISKLTVGVQNIISEYIINHCSSLLDRIGWIIGEKKKKNLLKTLLGHVLNYTEYGFSTRFPKADEIRVWLHTNKRSCLPKFDWCWGESSLGRSGVHFSRAGIFQYRWIHLHPPFYVGIPITSLSYVRSIFH